jgi:WD40-like Beta Propeller Repeat
MIKMIVKHYAYILTFLTLVSCQNDQKASTKIPPVSFGEPVKVTMRSYTGNLMEPDLSPDGNILLFNNLNQPSENTNLHWTTRVDDSTFQYQGEISGTNTSSLEGVPSLDRNGTLYFVSTRDYSTSMSTIYVCNYFNGDAQNVQLVTGISKLLGGYVNFDVEINPVGDVMYFVDAQFDQTGNPVTADFVIATKTNNSFQRMANSSEIMKNINTIDLEYAACISEDGLEFYFTRVPKSSNKTQILVSTRQKIDDPFGEPIILSSIAGFVEAPTLSKDKNILYFHKLNGSKFELFMVRRK